VSDISQYASALQSLCYNYFAKYCGTVESRVSNSNQSLVFENKYSALNCKKLKLTLKNLKCNNGNISEIKWLSHRIRQILHPLRAQSDLRSNINNKSLEEELLVRFWSACKKIFNQALSIMPKFSIIECENYFNTVLGRPSHSSAFTIPSWVPPFPLPSVPFNNDPPTYQEVATIINRTKSRGSPCPLDQISIIILKKCPIMRTAVHSLIAACWAQKRIPDCWRRALTILIYKKGSESDPANFRPITLQPVLYKILSTLLSKTLSISSCK
jgi:hypothetical protein